MVSTGSQWRRTEQDERADAKVAENMKQFRASCRRPWRGSSLRYSISMFNRPRDPKFIPNTQSAAYASEFLDVKSYVVPDSVFRLAEVKAEAPGFVVGPGAVKRVEYPEHGIRFLESYGATVCCIALAECSSGARAAMFHLDPGLGLDLSVSAGQLALADFVGPKISLFQGSSRNGPDYDRLRAVEGFFRAITQGTAYFGMVRATLRCENIVYDLGTKQIFDGVGTRISKQVSAIRFENREGGALEVV